MKQRLTFVVWNQISRRSAELSKRIGAEYINLGRVDRPTLKRLFNLVVNFFRTYSLFRDRRPEVIFTFHAHPMITLAAAIYKKFNRCQVVADLHSAAYLDHYRFPLKSLNRWVWKKADTLLIHNRMSQNYFNQNIPGYSGKLFVLEDPIPTVPVHIRKKYLYGIKGKFVGILVSRFSDDEPVLPFLEQIKEDDCHVLICCLSSVTPRKVISACQRNSHKQRNHPTTSTHLHHILAFSYFPQIE